MGESMSKTDCADNYLTSAMEPPMWAVFHLPIFVSITVKPVEHLDDRLKRREDRQRRWPEF